MKYNLQIHNRRSVRLKHYDYSNEGAYFITICSNERECLFGKIKDGKMILNANGKIAYNEWLKTTEIRSNVELDVFVIMPNHIHGIIIINNQMVDNCRGVLHTPGSIINECDNDPHKLYIPGAPNPDSPVNNQGVCNTPLQSSDKIMNVCNSSLRSPSNNIGAIVRGYKSAVTKQINILGSGNYDQSSTVWQRSFHDHIIRDAHSYQNISNYILNNPEKWDADRFNT